ncbi:caffeoylshikimate esterase-like [Salvia miltiorrhiza]|uniref:caffeoylshikimate esterase-like n=1 Tax=Salvia miltiorrhiza TaxID=226208 RepID=UPI0025AD1E91|nr:caffeoylshikimate esterase-like [Salvia miltiorrhiza]
MAHPIHEANEESPYGNLTKEEFYKKHDILHQESFMINSQNMRIFTQSWRPADPGRRVRALVGMIHGYTSESGWLFELNAVAAAKAGFLVVALDLQGHGLSDGPPDHIADVQPLLRDCLLFFDAARARHPRLPHFLYGESLGGALAALVCLRQKAAWRGLILSGAMCEVSRKFKPVWPLEKLLPAAAFVAPEWRIAITPPPGRLSYREGWKGRLAGRSPNRRTCGRPTAATALQLLNVCEYVKRNCGELEVAMLILHGGDDVICDPVGAEHLHRTAASKDKTLKIYDGVWHQLIGEPNDVVEENFNTVLTWIQVRADLANPN